MSELDLAGLVRQAHQSVSSLPTKLQGSALQTVLGKLLDNALARGQEGRRKKPKQKAARRRPGAKNVRTAVSPRREDEILQAIKQGTSDASDLGVATPTNRSGRLTQCLWALYVAKKKWGQEGLGAAHVAYIIQNKFNIANMRAVIASNTLRRVLSKHYVGRDKQKGDWAYRLLAPGDRALRGGTTEKGQSHK